VSVGFFFSIGRLHTGQFFRHILSNLPLLSQPGLVQSRNHAVELFPLFEGDKNGERFAIGRDRSRKTVKGRGVLGRHASLDMGIRGELENLLNGQVRKICV
jgi:hypothetical protein